MSSYLITPLPLPVPAENEPAEDSPFIIQFFMVQGVGFRCPAYRDHDGKWRDAFNNDELFGEIRILE